MENVTVDFNSNKLNYVNINSLITLQSELINFSRVSRLRNCPTRENCTPLKKGLCNSSVPSATWTRLRVKVM